MNIRFTKNRIEFKKQLNSLDKFVIEFTSILNRLKIKYVLVSGYVSILFGRNRASEDVDIIIEKLSFKEFNKLWKEINKKFVCINTENSKTAYKEYLLKNTSIRFSEKTKFIPNMEVKFPKTYLDLWTINQRKEVLLNKNKLFISPIELQIPFKLFLGSEKDIEDAKYLYRIFKNSIDLELLTDFNRKLKIEHVFNRYLR